MLERLSVNPSSGDPIYKQLHEQIVRLIAGGSLRAGEELPSVRKIAEHFAVNPMTVSRAISQLVEQGWLERRRGQATCVNAEPPVTGTEISGLLLSDIDKLIQQSKQLGISLQRLQQLIQQRWED
jgi:GntR family transcriptional regulator